MEISNCGCRKKQKLVSESGQGHQSNEYTPLINQLSGYVREEDAGGGGWKHDDETKKDKMQTMVKRVPNNSSTASAGTTTVHGHAPAPIHGATHGMYFMLIEICY